MGLVANPVHGSDDGVDASEMLFQGEFAGKIEADQADDDGQNPLARQDEHGNAC